MTMLLPLMTVLLPLLGLHCFASIVEPAMQTRTPLTASTATPLVRKTLSSSVSTALGSLFTKT